MSDALNRLEADALAACVALVVTGACALLGAPAAYVFAAFCVVAVGTAARMWAPLRSIWKGEDGGKGTDTDGAGGKGGAHGSSSDTDGDTGGGSASVEMCVHNPVARGTRAAEVRKEKAAEKDGSDLIFI